MNRMSYNEAVEIIEGMGKTFKMRALERKEATDPRYALVQVKADESTTDLVFFHTGFDVVRFAKYIKEEKPQSMKKAIDANIGEWWSGRQKEHTAEYFKEQAKLRKQAEAVAKTEYVDIVKGEKYYCTENDMEAMFS